MQRQARYYCPIDVTLSMIRGKWKPLILYSLKSGPRRFNALKVAVPTVSHKVLTQQLRALESSGLIECERNGAAATYRLTPFAKTLRPALSALANWGIEHHNDINARLLWPPAAERA